MVSGISTRSVQADVRAQDYMTKAGMDMKTAKQLYMFEIHRKAEGTSDNYLMGICL